MRSPKVQAVTSALCHLTKVENKTLLLQTSHIILEYAKRQTESVHEALLLLALLSRLESCYFEAWGRTVMNSLTWLQILWPTTTQSGQKSSLVQYWLVYYESNQPFLWIPGSFHGTMVLLWPWNGTQVEASPTLPSSIL